MKQETTHSPWEADPQPYPRAAAIFNAYLEKEGRNADDLERDLWMPICQLERELAVANASREPLLTFAKEEAKRSSSERATVRYERALALDCRIAHGDCEAATRETPPSTAASTDIDVLIYARNIIFTPEEERDHEKAIKTINALDRIVERLRSTPPTTKERDAHDLHLLSLAWFEYIREGRSADALFAAVKEAAEKFRDRYNGRAVPSTVEKPGTGCQHRSACHLCASSAIAPTGEKHG